MSMIHNCHFNYKRENCWFVMFGNGSSFYDRDSPLYTLPRHLPPTLVTDAVIVDSVIGDGCILSVRKHRKVLPYFCTLGLWIMFCFKFLFQMQKCRIKGSVIGMRTRIGNDAVVEDSIIMGSDIYHHVSNCAIFQGGSSSFIQKYYFVRWKVLVLFQCIGFSSYELIPFLT